MYIFFPFLLVKVMGSAIVEDVIAKQAGMGRSVSTHALARYPLRRASRSVREVLICPALEGVSEVPGTCHCYQKYHSK
jgi:hypothetical protein